MKPCLNPHPAVALGINPDTGKQYIKFLPIRSDVTLEDLKHKYGDSLYLMPCGQCENCLINKSYEWSIRCSLEAEYHPFNYFVTLTFDNEHIAYACFDDLKKFIDRLEGYHHKRTFKYFACLEEGELTHRKHFHLVLFCDFEFDLYDCTKIGQYFYYRSELLESLWTFGISNITPFEHYCAAYVAKYANKSRGSFLRMSRNLGKQYFIDHWQEIIKDGFKIYGRFGSQNHVFIPTCFIRWFTELNVPEIEGFKSFKSSLGKYLIANNFRFYGSNSIDRFYESNTRHYEEKLYYKERRKL